MPISATWIWIALAACNVSEPDSTLPFYNSAEFTPQWIQPGSVSEDFHRVPTFRLIDQNNNPITEKELDGKITVVNFFFTFCPGICPKLMKSMARVADAFPRDILLLSHSVTPDHDTVAKLRRYARQKNITASNWHLLTGERDLIYRLGRTVYFAEESLGEQKGPDEFLHTENLILVDRDRRLRGIYNGLNKTSVNQLMADIRTLQQEGP